MRRMIEAAEPSVPTAVAPPWRPRGETIRWLIIAAMIVFDLVGLNLGRIDVNWDSAIPSAELVAWVAIYGLAVQQVRRRLSRFPTTQRVATFMGDFCLSAVQLGAFSLISAPLTYILARTDLPLIDAQLIAIDHALGFDWAEAADWVTGHHPVVAVLRWAYFTHITQSWILIVLGSLWHPGRRNGEFIWTFMISLLICIALWVPGPALSMGGEVGSYMPVLKALRAGEPIMLDWGNLQGVVSFPSFHAALGVIYIYAARHRLWALIPFAALDTLMIIATPPIGGHYLTDTLAGVAVALVSILVARRLQRMERAA
jgi:hypothetical protein